MDDSDDDEGAAPKKGPKPQEAPKAARERGAAGAPEGAAAAEGQEQEPQEEAMQLSERQRLPLSFLTAVVKLERGHPGSQACCYFFCYIASCKGGTTVLTLPVTPNATSGASQANMDS